MATTAPVYSTTLPIRTAVQDGSTSGFPKGWNPMIGYGMPPDFFTTPSKAQFNASATQLMTPPSNASATQPMGSQQNTSAAQPNAQSTWSLQMAAQANASASHKKVYFMLRAIHEILKLKLCSFAFKRN